MTPFDKWLTTPPEDRWTAPDDWDEIGTDDEPPYDDDERAAEEAYANFLYWQGRDYR